MIDQVQWTSQYLHDHHPILQYAVFSISVSLVLVLIARQLEKQWPIDPDLPRAEVVSDWKVTAVNVGLAWFLAPLTAACSTAIVNLAGGGYIHLRTDGWWYGVSLVAFILAVDLYRYTTHRLSHAIPFLWALHSFHHSAEAITFPTGARHHWMDRVLNGACFPFLAILFRVPVDIATAASFIMFLPDGCAHLNVRLPLGRATMWINNPQWHRIHHSTQPEHFNKNFASVLPVWDLVFGTAWIPREEEYPATGLVPGEKCDIVTSIVWPFRRYLPRLKGHVRAWLPSGSRIWWKSSRSRPTREISEPRLELTERATPRGLELPL